MRGQALGRRGQTSNPNSGRKTFETVLEMA